MCCRNHSVPHLSEDHCEVLSDVGASDPTATGSRFSEYVIPEVKTLAEELGIDLTMPRRCARQVHRPKVGGSIEEYYRCTIYIPYMDSLTQSLESRFGGSNTPYFHMFALHPREMQQTQRD